MSVRMWDFSCHIENVWHSSSQNWVRNGKDSITFGDSFRMHYLCSQKRITHEEISIAGSCLSLYCKLREGCTGDIPGTGNLLRHYHIAPIHRTLVQSCIASKVNLEMSVFVLSHVIIHSSKITGTVASLLQVGHQFR